jgi:hypothetical protein
MNMTPDQIWAERVLGKTIADLAKEKSVSDQQLIDALVASQKTMLDQAVTNGRLTQAQADKWLDWYKQAAALQLTEPYIGFGGMRGGPGGMRGRGHWGGGAAPQSLERTSLVFIKSLHDCDTIKLCSAVTAQPSLFAAGPRLREQ